MFDRRYNSSPLTAAILATLYPSLSVGQQGHKESGQLETIIVTATRRELNLQEVGQSITAFSTADIERQALQDAEDVIGALTSVNLVNNQPGRNQIFMRGISTGSDEYYTDSQVSIYLDDQPLTSVSQQVDIRPIDIERIESLPGPQGTLFGSSSQSGTLRYITNKPDPAGLFRAGRPRGGHDQGRRGELRRQRSPQHPDQRPASPCASSASTRRRRLRRQRPGRDVHGRPRQRGTRRGRLERLRDLRRPHRGALDDQSPSGRRRSA